MTLDSKNILKLLFVQTFWEKQVCCVFESLNCPLGLILPSSWADLAPKYDPEWAPKWVPKVVQQVNEK